MIVLKVEIDGIGAILVPSKRDPPVRIDLHGVAALLIALHRVNGEGNDGGDVIELGCVVEHREDEPDTYHLVWADEALISFGPIPFQYLRLEAFDQSLCPSVMIKKMYSITAHV